MSAAVEGETGAGGEPLLPHKVYPVDPEQGRLP